MHALVMALLLATAPIIVDTSKLAEGEKLTGAIDGATFTVTREGNTRIVIIERDGRRDMVTIEKDGDQLRVGTNRRGGDAMLVPAPRIIVDGIGIEPFITDTMLNRPRRSARVYVCPKDQVELRLPTLGHFGDFRCPLDGTIMRPAQQPEYFLLELSND